MMEGLVGEIKLVDFMVNKVGSLSFLMFCKACIMLLPAARALHSYCYKALVTGRYPFQSLTRKIQVNTPFIAASKMLKLFLKEVFLLLTISTKTYITQIKTIIKQKLHCLIILKIMAIRETQEGLENNAIYKQMLFYWSPISI